MALLLIFVHKLGALYSAFCWSLVKMHNCHYIAVVVVLVLIIVGICQLVPTGRQRHPMRSQRHPMRSRRHPICVNPRDGSSKAPGLLSGRTALRHTRKDGDGFLIGSYLPGDENNGNPYALSECVEAPRKKFADRFSGEPFVPHRWHETRRRTGSGRGRAHLWPYWGFDYNPPWSVAPRDLTLVEPPVPPAWYLESHPLSLDIAAPLANYWNRI
jgi:hypothetical protein